MKRILTMLALVLLCGATTTMMAQEESGFKHAMQTVGQGTKKGARAVAGKDENGNKKARSKGKKEK